MSQTENAVTSSTSIKRTYRKCNPVPARERQRASLARRSNSHKAFHAVIQVQLKDRLSELTDEEGITQAQMFEKLIGWQRAGSEVDLQEPEKRKPR